MKLQLSETIPAQNQDLVLRTLELCLRDVSLEVARSGNQLTAYGIGPSHRAKNRNDKTVVNISSDQGMTVIHVDSSYQASALLGDQPQDDLIRSKFELVFECMKTQLSSDSSACVFTSASLQAGLAQSVEATQSPEPQTDSVTAPVQPAATELHAKPEPTLATPRIPRAESLNEPPPPEVDSRYSRRSRVIFAALFTLCLLLVPTLRQRYSSYSAKQSVASQATTQTEGIAASPPSTDTTTRTNAPSSEAPLTGISTPPPPPTETVASGAVTSTLPNQPQDKKSLLRHRLEDWGVALRSRDAAVQASFYSTRVHPYFLNQDVDNDFIRRDKQASIQQRKGLWTVKLENIVIEDETSSTARVQLIKHFIDQPAQSSITEQFVLTRLHLKRVNGQWYITAERDLP